MKRRMFMSVKGILMTAGVAALCLTGCGGAETAKQQESTNSGAETADQQENANGGTETADQQENTGSGTDESAEKVIAPLDGIEISDVMPDGDYMVSFTADDFSQEGDVSKLNVEVFDAVAYSADEILALQEGDVIQTQNGDVVVESIDTYSDDAGNTHSIDINGGVEMDGICLRVSSDGNRFQMSLPVGDYLDTYSVGEAALVISPEVSFTDCYDYDTLPDGVSVAYDEIGSYLAEMTDTTFSDMNTVITVKNGEIVSIVRNWTP